MSARLEDAAEIGKVWFRRRPKSSDVGCLIAVLLSVTAVAHANNLVPAARQTKPVLLTGGMVVTVSGVTHHQADVLIVDGKIAQIAPMIAAPAGAEVIDVKGKRVYPGFIAA